MSKPKFVETETHTLNQVRYKVITESSFEKIMEALLSDNNPCDVKKITIQPKNETEKYSYYPSGAIEGDDTPWVKNRPWIAHNNNRIE